MSRRPPEVREADEHGLIVHRTHDVELAEQLALGYARDQYGWADVPAGVRTWLRVVQRPKDDPRGAYEYRPGTPGGHGTFAAVEFPWDGNPIGTPADTGDES